MVPGGEGTWIEIDWILELAVILLAAKLGAEIFARLKQSPMLGEILAGVILGSSVLGLFHESKILELFAEIGIIFMIFMLGLETNVAHMRKVGAEATAIALAGIAVPFAAGWFIGVIMGEPWSVSLFFGAILTATSVAVTARTLIDLDLTRSRLAQTVLAAAVIDDIVGLLVLAVVLAVTGTSGEVDILQTAIRSGVFLLVIFPIFWFLIPPLVRQMTRMEGEGALFVMVLGLTFLFSYMAKAAGLAYIVGAFLIGMIFGRTSSGAVIQEQVEPIYYFMAPVFFVSIGIAVHVEQLWDVIIFAVIFAAVAIGTKIIGGIIGGSLFRMRFSTAALVGIAMIPRGEVGLIVANLGLKNGIIDIKLFSAAAFMSVLTILVTPAFLKMMVRRFYQGED